MIDYKLLVKIAEASMEMRRAQKRCPDKRRQTADVRRAVKESEDAVDELLRLYRFERRQLDMFGIDND